MTKKIAIVGCGPAGLSCAVALHDRGFDVTLYEQFKQPGPVGSGLMLQPTGLLALESLGLRTQAEALGQRIDGMLGRLAQNGKVVLDIKYQSVNKELYGVAIHRASLFHVLYCAAVDRGIRIVTGCKISSLHWHDDERLSLLDDHGNTAGEAADLVVDASGVQSRLLKYAATPPASTVSTDSAGPTDQTPVGRPLDFGALWTTVELPDHTFSRTLLEQRYDKASIMVGVLPCGTLPDSTTRLATLFWSIKAQDFPRWQSNGLAQWKDDVIQYWPEVGSLLEQIDHADQLTHASYSHHTLKKPFGRSLIFAGDAAHATSPQLGQGANMALLDALAVAAALGKTRNTNDACQLYSRLRSKHVNWYQAISFLLTPFYQSDSTVLPLLRDSLFQPVSAVGFMDRFITRLGAGLLTDPLATINKHGQ